MAPVRRKGSGRAAAAARGQWNVGDLVLAKLKGFPAWPATITKPEMWGYRSDERRLLVYFFGTKEIAFCNCADLEAFTEDKRKSLLSKRQGKRAAFVRAVDEIIGIYEKLNRRRDHEKFNSVDEGTGSSAGSSKGSKSKSFDKSPELSSHHDHQSDPLYVSTASRDVFDHGEISATSTEGNPHDTSTVPNDPTRTISTLDRPRQETQLSTTTSSSSSSSNSRDAPPQRIDIHRGVPSVQRSASSSWEYLYKYETELIPESSLPPLKRLRRALEAMDAILAEATDDHPEAMEAMESVSPKANSLHVSTDDRIVGSPTKAQDSQPSDDNASGTILSSRSASETQEVSESKPDEILAENISSCNKDSCGIIMGVDDRDEPSISRMVYMDVHEKSLKPCSFKPTKKPNILLPLKV